MALTFPVPAALFASTLKIRESQFWRADFVETSGTGRGDVLTREIAAPKWQARIMLAPMSYDDAGAAQAMIEAIGPHGLFFLYNPMKPYPRMDPGGVIYDGAAPTIHTIGADNLSVRIAGLPTGYVLSPGDMFSYSFGTGASRHALCRVAETATASGTGITPLFAVSSPLRIGTVVGRGVLFRKPQAKMMFAPGSYEPGAGTIDRVTTGMAFQAIEAY